MLNLTPSEQRTIFIIIGIISLAGIFFIIGSYRENPLINDYTQSDSIFSRLSHKPLINQKLYSQDTPGKIHESHPITNKSRPPLKIENESIDINHATQNELMKLPRIGPAMANRIIDYRNANGPFKSLEELIKVKGIGKKTLSVIKPYLRNIQ